MGISKEDSEEVNKIELHWIREKLRPEEQHQWKMIRENLPTELVISYRSAINEACSYVSGYETIVLEKDRIRMVENGCEVIRERLLRNPVFPVG